VAKEWPQRGIAMDRQVCLSVEQFIQQMRGPFEQAMRQVADAVTQAPDGLWINGSEVQVRDVMAEFRRKAYQTALQMRVDAAEGAFSTGGPARARNGGFLQSNTGRINATRSSRR